MIRETSLNVSFGLEAMLFDEPSRMMLRAIKRESEQQKTLKYANTK